jgi:hypothetical protein
MPELSVDTFALEPSYYSNFAENACAMCPGPTNATPAEKIDTASLLDIELLGPESLHWVDLGSSARGKPSRGHCYASNGGDRHDDCGGIERAQLVKQTLEDVRRTQSDRDADSKSESQEENTLAHDQPQD